MLKAPGDGVPAPGLDRETDPREAQRGPQGCAGLRAKHLPPLRFEANSELKEIMLAHGTGRCPWHMKVSMAQAASQPDHTASG